MSYSYLKCSCNLKNPIKVGDITIETREWIEVSNGNFSVDLAPLPGLHQESLPESFIDFTSKKFKTPSALFVREVFDIFTDVEEVQAESNKLLYIDLAKSPKEISSRLVQDGIYKIKIGRDDLSLESLWLKELLSNLSEGISVRLDGNMAFAAKDLNRYLEKLDLTRVQYIEEPLTDVRDWKTLDRRNELKLALDENISLRRELDFANYLVAKPTWNISLRDTLKELALENQEVIISSAFEPPNNLKILNMIAREGDQVAGLDTLKFFDLESLKVSPL